MPDSFKDLFPPRDLPTGRAMIQFKCYVDERLEQIQKDQIAVLKVVRDTIAGITEDLKEHNQQSIR